MTAPAERVGVLEDIRAHGVFPHWLDLRDVDAALTAAIAALRAQQEPVAWQFKDDLTGEWRNFVNDQHRDNTIADGRWEVRALYAAPPATPEPKASA